jgi:hypothetical protein
VAGLEQVLYGSRKETAVPELSNGTGYSSGTAMVDRLVGSTNGGGMQGLAAQANAWPGQPAQPQPVAAAAPQPSLPPVRPAAASPYPVQQPVAAPNYPAPQQPMAAPGYPGPQPTNWPAAAQGPGAMPAQMPPAAMPGPAQSAGLQPAAQTGMPGMAGAPSMGAQGGLTAAQVRGRTQPEPPPPQPEGGWGAVGAMLYNQAG